MKRRVSSATTFFLKFIFPTFFLIGFSGIVIDSIKTFGIYEALPFSIGLLIAIPFFYFFFFRIKEVEMDTTFFYISNFRENIKVKIKDVKSISENKFSNPRLITIEFNHNTEFGKKVVFMAPLKFFIIFTEAHPLVRELENIVTLKKNNLQKYRE